MLWFGDSWGGDHIGGTAPGKGIARVPDDLLGLSVVPSTSRPLRGVPSTSRPLWVVPESPEIAAL